MLHKATQLRGAAVRAADGDLGVVDDLYFDDERWGIRYLVVKTGGWPHERKVLVPPAAILREGSTDRQLQLAMAKDDVLAAPMVDTDRPISRRHEMAFAAYYGHAPYWSETGSASAAALTSPARPSLDGASHLHSTREIARCSLAAPDGDIGRVEDLLIDEETWDVAQLVVDTRPWLPGGQVGVPTAVARAVDVEAGRIFVDIEKNAVKQWPSVH